MIFYMIKFIFRLLKSFSKGINNIYNFFFLKLFKVNYKSNLEIKGKIFLRNSGSLILGHNVTINSSYSANPIGGMSFSSIVVTKKGRLVISDNVGISNTAIFCTSSIHIGYRVFIGGDCKIYDTDFHSIDRLKRLNNDDIGKSKPVVIGDDVFIGTGCIILKGVEIGCNSVIGAGSLVTKSIPKNQVWGGNPIRFIKNLSD